MVENLITSIRVEYGMIIFASNFADDCSLRFVIGDVIDSTSVDLVDQGLHDLNDLVPDEIVQATREPLVGLRSITTRH